MGARNRVVPSTHGTCGEVPPTPLGGSCLENCYQGLRSFTLAYPWLISLHASGVGKMDKLEGPVYDRLYSAQSTRMIHCGKTGSSRSVVYTNDRLPGR